MDTGLIFDIGSNYGDDALFYAAQGYNVIAVDADPVIIQALQVKYAAHPHADRLLFLNCAITDRDGEVIDFYQNADSAKNSVVASVGNRNDALTNVLQVRTRTLRSLMEEYGVPHYCKIDIEGYDPVAVRSAAGGAVLPQFMSAEAECKSDEDKFNEDGIFDSLDALHAIGYTRFKLVDQTTLFVLGKEDFYGRRESLYYKLRRKLEKLTGSYSALYTNKQRLIRKYDYPFVHDASGPFGTDLEGSWMSIDEARSLYLFHRRSFFKSAFNRQYSLWADWHATK